MTDRTVINRARSIILPAAADPVKIANASSPTLAPWFALRCRVRFETGQCVLVLRATGGAGRPAVQVAKHLGAWQLVAAGRDQLKLATLPALGATEVM